MADITDKFGKASIDTDYAIATTVKTTRVPGATVLEAFDLSKFSDDTPVFFVTYKKTTDPVTNVTSVTNLVSWKGLVNTGANTLTNLELAPGYADTGNAIGDFIECIPTSHWVNSLIEGIFVGHNPDGSFKKSRLQTDLGNDGRLVDTLDELTSNFVLSGGVWTVAAGLNGTMTALAGYINGYKNTVAAVATRAYTPTKDTYVDVLKNAVTHAFSLVYTEVANGAAAPALAANSIRLAKIVTSGAAITTITQSGFDSLQNQIFPRASISGADVNFPSFNWYGYRPGVVNTNTGSPYVFVALSGGLTVTFPAIAGQVFEVMISSSFVSPSTNTQADIQARMSDNPTANLMDAIVTNSNAGAIGAPQMARAPWTAPSTGNFTLTCGVTAGTATTMRTDGYMATVRRIG